MNRRPVYLYATSGLFLGIGFLDGGCTGKQSLENTAVSLEINNNVLHIRIQGPRNGLALMKVITPDTGSENKSSLN